MISSRRLWIEKQHLINVPAVTDNVANADRDENPEVFRANTF